MTRFVIPDGVRTQSASLLGILVGGLIVTFVLRALKGADGSHWDPDARPKPAPPDKDDPRWGPADGRVQIAGKSCMACQERITVATEGVPCEVCRQACHTSCVARHVAEAHRPDEGTPYR